MKKLKFLTAVLIAGLLISCGGGDKKKDQNKSSSSENEETTIKDAVNAAHGLGKMADSAEEMQTLQKKLSKMKPASKEILKKVIPERLLGIERTRLRLSSKAMYGNVLIGHATYKKDNQHSLQLSITDGAGKTGSNVVFMSIWSLKSDLEEETKHGFTKTKEIDGRRVKAEQTTHHDHVRSTYTFAVNERFLVILEGDGFSTIELHKAYDSLNFDALPK